MIAVCSISGEKRTNLWQLFIKQKYCGTWDFRIPYVLKPENTLYNLSISVTKRSLITTKPFECEKFQNVLFEE